MNPVSVALLPVTVGPRGLFWVFRKVAEEADREQNDPVRIRGKLLYLQRQAAAGAISERQYEQAEELLLARLDHIELLAQASQSGADVSPGQARKLRIPSRRPSRIPRQRLVSPTFSAGPAGSSGSSGAEVGANER